MRFFSHLKLAGRDTGKIKNKNNHRRKGHRQGQKGKTLTKKLGQGKEKQRKVLEQEQEDRTSKGTVSRTESGKTTGTVSRKQDRYNKKNKISSRQTQEQKLGMKKKPQEHEHENDKTKKKNGNSVWDKKGFGRRTESVTY